jgi:hypothetical protein
LTPILLYNNNQININLTASRKAIKEKEEENMSANRIC